MQIVRHRPAGGAFCFEQCIEHDALQSVRQGFAECG
jgi:hypothetical protein